MRDLVGEAQRGDGLGVGSVDARRGEAGGRAMLGANLRSGGQTRGIGGGDGCLLLQSGAIKHCDGGAADDEGRRAIPKRELRGNEIRRSLRLT